MKNNILSGEFARQEAFEELVKEIGDSEVSRIQVKGLYGSSKSLLFSSSLGKGVNFVIMDNKEEAQFFTNDLYNLLDEESVFFFPTSSNFISNKINTIKDSSQKVQRSAAISALNSFVNGKNKEKSIVVVAYPASIYENIPNSKVLKKNILSIKKGEMVSHEFIKEALQEYKFEKVDFVGEPGQFALRGSIIDLFSYSSDKPYRIDFFGNEVESIREFDTNTQRSQQELEKIEIFPNIYDEGGIDTGEGTDVFEFVGKGNSTVWVNDITVLQGEQYDKVRESIFRNRVISFNHLEGNVSEVEFRVSPQPSFNKNFGLLLSDINKKIADGYTIYISSENERQFERLRNIFAHNNGDNISSVPKFTEMHCSLHTGFVDTITKICLYTDHQIFDRYHRVKIKREVPRSERLTLNELSAFQIGDYIVHIDHGVGIFGGLVKTNINGKVQEAIKLIYKDNDVIFVSIHGIHRIPDIKARRVLLQKYTSWGLGHGKNSRHRPRTR